MEQKSDYQETIEVDLGKYIRMAAKHKVTILVVFLAFVLLGALYILLAPKIYRVTMTVQPPIAGEVLSGSSNLDSSENIKSLIENEAFNQKIIKKLALFYKNVNPKIVKFKITRSTRDNMVKTNFIQISMDVVGKDRELGIRALNELYNEISKPYDDRVKFKNVSVDKHIEIISNGIEAYREKIKLFEGQIKEYAFREEELLKEIKDVNGNTQKLLDKQDALVKNKANANDLSALLYSNIVQQNIAYLNDLNNQLSALRVKSEGAYFEIKQAQTGIDNAQIEMDRLNLSKVYISNAKLLQEPEASIYPVWPKNKLCLTLMAILGLFLGMLVAIFWEYRVGNSQKA